MANQDQVDVMLDLETVGISANAPVISIGAVAFTRNYKEEEPTKRRDICTDKPGAMFEGYLSAFYTSISLLDNLAKGRTIDKSTAEFWQKQQDQSPLQESMLSKVSIEQAVATFNDWLRSQGKVYLWAKSPTFDITIMRNLCSSIGKELSVPYYRELDVRTVLELGDVDIKKIGLEVLLNGQNVGLHHAMYDCAIQIEAIQQYCLLNVRP